MAVAPGDAFWGATDPAKPPHLFVVLHVVASPFNGQVAVVVNLTSSPISDASCVLAVGEHPSITKKCSAYYQRAQEVRGADLEVAFTRAPKASSALLKRLRTGLHASQFVRERLKAIVPKP